MNASISGSSTGGCFARLFVWVVFLMRDLVSSRGPTKRFSNEFVFAPSLLCYKTMINSAGTGFSHCPKPRVLLAEDSARCLPLYLLSLRARRASSAHAHVLRLPNERPISLQVSSHFCARKCRGAHLFRELLFSGSDSSVGLLPFGWLSYLRCSGRGSNNFRTL